MIKKQSAGIMMFKIQKDELMIFLVHPGGPFWQKKDEGSWSIPKGEFDEGENALEAAIREFVEETGYTISGNFIELTPIKQKSGKMVYAWAIENNVDAENVNPPVSMKTCPL